MKKARTVFGQFVNIDRILRSFRESRKNGTVRRFVP